MVVVACRAPPVGDFPEPCPELVGFTVFGHRLQRSVDGGEPDLFALRPEVFVDLLRGLKTGCGI